MRYLDKFFQSVEFKNIALSVMGIILIILFLIFVLFIIKNKLLKRKMRDTTKPEAGEIRNGKIYCKLTDPVYSSFHSKEANSNVQDHINVEFEADFEECIGIRYYAISKNGRFLIVLNGSEYWLEPQEYFDKYSIYVRRKESENSSK